MRHEKHADFEEQQSLCVCVHLCVPVKSKRAEPQKQASPTPDHRSAGRECESCRKAEPPRLTQALATRGRVNTENCHMHTGEWTTGLMTANQCHSARGKGNISLDRRCVRTQTQVLHTQPKPGTSNVHPSESAAPSGSPLGLMIV